MEWDDNMEVTGEGMSNHISPEFIHPFLYIP